VSVPRPRDVSCLRSAGRLALVPVAILDIDGTLVDTNYHHTVAWYRAFRQNGIVLPLWRIHRHMGMGGDQLVAELTDDATEEEKGDEIRGAEKALYMAFIEEVEPMEGSRELIEDLKARGHTVVLASSAKEDEVNHYLDQLDARELADDWTTSADVESTKPQPDLVQAALDKAGEDDGVMIGDTPWDIEAAKRAGVETIAVLTGGFSRAELEEAGAVAVFESVAELRHRLGETALG
jgi:HAD superfamily hydrolase (TIGR01509 family)